MPAPSRSRRQAPSAAPQPLEALSQIQARHEEWKRTQPGGRPPGKGPQKEHWRELDARHGQRPDYLLWRQRPGAECPPERRVDATELLLKSLRHKDAEVRWAGRAILPWVLADGGAKPARRQEVAQALFPKQGSGADASPPGAAGTAALVAWQARAVCGAEPDLPGLAAVWTALRADWKPGRAAPVECLRQERWLPVPVKVFLHQLCAQIQRAAGGAGVEPREAAGWCLTAWQLLRDARPVEAATTVAEVEALLVAAQAARLAGDALDSARLTALALQLLPPQLPAALHQRAGVAAWALAELGMAVPAAFRAQLEEMPFPGEPPASEKGQALRALLWDDKNPFHAKLAGEVESSPDWAPLRQAGVVLTHPLAALAWVARKAQSYAVKKQHELLGAAWRLAITHQALWSAGRILAQHALGLPAVVEHARALRQAQRRMPWLRDAEAWEGLMGDLRLAWGRVEEGRPADDEELFLLHETLLDREVTLLRSLPLELRTQALRHLHTRKPPSALVRSLEADPRLLQQLEHQRAVELWSVASAAKERPELAQVAWASLVRRGEAAAGRYSLLVQGPAGRVVVQGRMRASSAAESAQERALLWEGLDARPLVDALAAAVAEVTGAAGCAHILLAVETGLSQVPWEDALASAGCTAQAARIPSWEWAYRVLRESAPAVASPAEVLATEPPAPDGRPAIDEAFCSRLKAGVCLLLPGPEADAGTRWFSATPAAAELDGRAVAPAPRRSLHVGGYPQVAGLRPLASIAWPGDLVRLCLAQSSRRVLTPPAALSPEEVEAALQRVQNGVLGPGQGWHCFGLSWG